MWKGKAADFSGRYASRFFFQQHGISNSSLRCSANNFSKHAMCHFRMLIYTLTDGYTDQQEVPLGHGGEIL